MLVKDFRHTSTDDKRGTVYTEINCADELCIDDVSILGGNSVEKVLLR